MHQPLVPTLAQKLAIVVLSFNHPELTARAVTSALALHDKVFLVHNGSEKKFVAHLENLFPQISHLKLEKNRGYSGGVNFGLNEAFRACNWVMLLTNDCLLKNLPELPLTPALVAPHILIQKSERTDSLGGAFIPYRGHLFHCKSEEDFRRAKNPYIPGSAFLIHQKLYQTTGPFDERLGTYWEDVDFSQRAARAGFALRIDANWRLTHGRGKTCHKHRHYTLYLYQRNRKRISFKYTSGAYKPILFIILWMMWIKMAIRLLLSSRRADLKILLSAIWDEGYSRNSKARVQLDSRPQNA
jgi:GT2 family glycosyltransferase